MFCSEECKTLFNWHKAGEPKCKVCGSPCYDLGVYCSPICYKKGQSMFNSFKDPATKEKIKETAIKKYGSLENLYKHQNITRKKNLQEKYGNHVTSTFQIPSAIEKTKKTNIERYGCEDARKSDYVKSKRENTIKETGVSGRFHTKEWDDTMIEKYGTTTALKNEEIYKKFLHTLQERYGVVAPAQLDWVKEKTKKTCLRKYGVEYTFQSANTKCKSKQTMLKKYGVDNAIFLQRHYGSISNINKEFGHDLNLSEDQYEYRIGKAFFDFKIDDTLVEINPTYTHNSDKAPAFAKSQKPKDKCYHLKKTQTGLNAGFKVFNVWDWDDIDKVKSYFLQKKNKIKVFARKCEIGLISKELSDYFLDEFDFYGKCDNDIIRIGLVYKDELIGLMTFGMNDQSSKTDFVLHHLCFDFKYDVIGGSEKMFKFFVSNFNPDTIISCNDISKFSGKVYDRLGFELVEVQKPMAHWCNKDEHIADEDFHQHDIKKQMLENGWVRVYDCGISVHRWKRC